MKLSFIEKAGYSLGDAAANFVFMTMILFQLNFYTPIIAGIVFCLVLAAIFDAIILISVRLATPWTRAVKAR